MKQAPSVRKNFIMNFILTISNFIFPLITLPYVSRVLQAEGVGAVVFVSSNVSYFAMLAMLGIPTYGIRACAKIREDKEKLSKTVQEILLINLVMTVIALIALAVTVLMVDQFYQYKELYLILSTSLVFNMLGVDWLYRALEQYSYITIRSIVFKFLSVLLLLLFVKSKEDYITYGAITVFAGVGSNVMNLINLRKLISLKPAKDLQMSQHLRPILTFFMLTVSTTIYLNVDTTFLGFIKGEEAVGYYAAAVKVKQILVSVVTSLGAVLLPRLSFYHEQGLVEEFERLTRKAFNFVFVLALPLVIYFTLLAKQSILFLSGEDFLPAVLPMQLIMPTVLCIGLSNLMGIQILVPTNREKLVVLSTIIGAIVDLLINLVVIPKFGASGAAFAGSVAEFTVAFVQLYILKDLVFPILRKLQFTKMFAAIFAASLLTIALLSVTSQGLFISLVLTSLVFFGTYGLILLALKEPFVTQFLQSIRSKMP